MSLRSVAIDGVRSAPMTASPPSPVCGCQHQIVRRIDRAESGRLFDAGVPCRLRCTTWQAGASAVPEWPMAAHGRPNVPESRRRRRENTLGSGGFPAPAKGWLRISASTSRLVWVWSDTRSPSRIPHLFHHPHALRGGVSRSSAPEASCHSNTASADAGMREVADERDAVHDELRPPRR